MSKKTSRSIALGLFVSGLIVLGLDVWGADLTGIPRTDGSDAVTESLSELEEKVEALEEENSRLLDEHDRLTEGYASSLTLSDIEESGQADDANVTTSSEDAEDAEETEETEETGDQFTITVREGEPSSVVAKQLETLGVIEDRLAFNDYLEKNDYARKVRPGNYVVSTDMSTDELVQAIIK